MFCGNFFGKRQLHGRRIERLGNRRTDIIVDRLGDPFGRGEVGIAQSKPQLTDAIEREFDLALDDGAVGQPSDGRHAAGDARALALGLKAADGQRALGDRIDVAVGAQERRDQ